MHDACVAASSCYILPHAPRQRKALLGGHESNKERSWRRTMSSCCWKCRRRRREQPGAQLRSNLHQLWDGAVK